MPFERVENLDEKDPRSACRIQDFERWRIEVLPNR
jgi:hypothetical protein